MFKLVGRETFNIGKVKGTINIDASGGFSYEYTLDVDGKSLKKFVEQRSKTARVWCTSIGGIDYRIVLGKFDCKVGLEFYSTSQSSGFKPLLKNSMLKILV